MYKFRNKMLTSIMIIFLIICSINIVLPCKVNASVASTDSYYSPSSFSFTGTSSQYIKQYSGTFMAIEVSATSSSGSSNLVTMTVYIASRNVTKTYTFYSNGSKNKFDYIFLGLSGSSSVSIGFSCNSSDTINVSLTAYSW